jgi:hypothetical protein
MVSSFNGWGVSAVDGLDTMIVMGLNDEVDRVLAHIGQLRLDKVDSPFPQLKIYLAYEF